MKRFIAILICITCFASTALYAEGDYEYVFNETQLREFLAENIREAVDKVTAELTRSHEIEIIDLNKDHATEKAIMDQQVRDESARADGLARELRFANFKLIVGVSTAAAAGVGIGYLIGNFF